MAIIFPTIALFVSLIIYIPTNLSFRPWLNYISDLGTGSLGANIALGCMFVGFAVIFFLLLIGITNEYRENKALKSLINSCIIFTLIAQIALIIQGIFPMDPIMPANYTIHKIAAVFYISFGAISFIHLGILDRSIHKGSSTVAFLTALDQIFYGIGFVIQEFGKINVHQIFYIANWAYFLLLMLWLVLKLIQFWKK